MNDWKEPVLWKHQLDAVEAARHLNQFAFLFDAGCGKTATLIRVLRLKFAEAKKILPTLIIAPVIVLENWKNEWKKFSRIPSERICVLLGTSKNRLNTFAQFRRKFGDEFIIVINYDILVTCSVLVSELRAWGPQCLVIDESQRIKSLQSKRTKICVRFAEYATYRYLLSGTPILNSPMDIFSQWLTLDKGATFGKNFFIFRAKYFYDKNCNMPKQSYFPNWQIRPSSYEEISSLISTCSMRAKKEDCLDLPPLVKQQIAVDLSPDQWRHYNNMTKDLVTYLDNSAVVADIALTKMLRLLQIISGFMKDENNQVYEFEKTPRLQALAELLGDITPNNKVIIWCIFKDNYKQIRGVCEKLGIKYVESHGEISTTVKYKNVDLFNNHEDYRVFIGHPASLGIGINLCSASYSIIYSRNWSLEQDLQSEARNYRAGSERHNKITKIDLVAKKTIDEGILEVLANKMKDANKIVGVIKNYLRS